MLNIWTARKTIICFQVFLIAYVCLRTWYLHQTDGSDNDWCLVLSVAWESSVES